jgi:hypothetical protein
LVRETVGELGSPARRSCEPEQSLGPPCETGFASTRDHSAIVAAFDAHLKRIYDTTRLILTETAST